MTISDQAWAAFEAWHPVAHAHIDCDDQQAEELAYVAGFTAASPANVDHDIAALKIALTGAVSATSEPQELLNDLRDHLGSLSPVQGNPIDVVKWVLVDDVQANGYNPNSVAPNEMRLLYVSIQHDGLTQPIVTFWDAELSKFIIVDGFHRYSTLRLNKDLLDRNHGRIPVVVIDKDINDRMASTIRHNRARGKHSIAGMGNIVFNMLQNGATDEHICNEVGLEPEELIRLKYVTGFAKLFENVQYGTAWETDTQIRERRNYQEANPNE
jgi:hypothetical protein